MAALRYRDPWRARRRPLLTTVVVAACGGALVWGDAVSGWPDVPAPVASSPPPVDAAALLQATNADVDAETVSAEPGLGAPAVAASALPASWTVARPGRPGDAEDLQVAVVDDREQPVAGAVVTTIDGERDLARARTDATGRAVVSLPGTVRVTAAGHWPTTTVVPRQGGSCRIELARAPRLRGLVFAADGTPRAGARVVLLPMLANRRGWPMTLPPQAPVAVADARGAFELPWPDAGLHDLAVTATGDAPTVVPALRAGSVDTAPLVVVLAAAAQLTGRAQVGARPLPHARVEVWSAAEPGAAAAPAVATPWLGGQLLATTATDGVGAFTFAGLPPGTAWAILPDEAEAAVRIELRAGVPATVQLDAAPRATLGGELDPRQAGAEVFLFGRGRCLHTVVTTATGAFTFPPVPPGCYLVGSAEDPAAVHTTVQEFVLHGRGAGGQVVDLTAGASRQVVVPAGGVATGGIEGVAFVAGQPAGGHAVVLESVPPVGARRRRTEADAGGAFRLESLPLGDYDVQLVANDGRVLARAPCRVQRGGGTTLTLVSP